MPASKKTKKLGKGLDAIFGEASQGGDLQSVISAIEKKAPQLSQVEVKLKDIRPNPYQPRKHFDEEKLKRIKSGALIIDLASYPGGVDFEKAKELGIKTIHALSLPGKVAPKSAGEIIESTILSILKEDDG